MGAPELQEDQGPPMPGDVPKLQLNNGNSTATSSPSTPGRRTPRTGRGERHRQELTPEKIQEELHEVQVVTGTSVASGTAVGVYAYAVADASLMGTLTMGVCAAAVAGGLLAKVGYDW